jgi:acetyltransferase-like isoleucine patch superfamily enzyme
MSHLCFNLIGFNKEKSSFSIAESACIDSSVKIVCDDLYIGNNVTIGSDVKLVGDSIHISENVNIQKYVDIRSAEVIIGKDAVIQASCNILVSDSFSIGPGSLICEDVEISCRKFEAGKLFFIGNDSIVGAGGHYESTAEIIIGDRVALSPNNTINVNKFVSIGDDVGTGRNCSFWTHGYHFGHTIIDGFGPVYKEIAIKNNVWIATNVVLLPGVSIGENTIIAAGSIVNKKLPKNVLAGGVPAKVIKEIHKQTYRPSDISSIILKWIKELIWKGLEVSFIYNNEQIIADIYYPKESCHIKLNYAHNSSDIEVKDELKNILIYCIDDANLKVSGSENIFFCLLEQKIYGSMCTVSHDLRDFLRRNTLPCGDNFPFKSILPEGFNRLKKI